MPFSFEDIGKRKKFLIFGLTSFFIVLFLILFYSGFFSLALAGWFFDNGIREPAFELNLPDDSSYLEFKIFGSSIKPIADISVCKNEVNLFEIKNKDYTDHSLLILYKTPEDKEYQVIHEKIMDVEGDAFQFGFMNPEVGQDRPVIYQPDLFFLIYIPDAQQYMLSCTTCSGENSQIQIFLE